MTYLRDLWTFFQVKAFLYREGREVHRRFPAFAPYERALRKAYRFSNPFTISKSFLKKRGEADVHAYGETPLPVFALIAKECNLGPKDLLVELGCGRGRGALFLSHLTGCSVEGIDWVPKFIRKANAVLESAKPRLPVRFRQENIEEADLGEATFVYLYGTCLSDEAIWALIGRFKKLSPTAKIITVSYPLCDYSCRFRTVKQFTVTFPWGEAEVYLNARIAF